MRGRWGQELHRLGSSARDGDSWMKLPCKDTEMPNLPAASPSKDRKERILLNSKKAVVVQTSGEIIKPLEMT